VENPNGSPTALLGYPDITFFLRYIFPHTVFTVFQSSTNDEMVINSLNSLFAECSVDPATPAEVRLAKEGVEVSPLIRTSQRM